MTQYILCSTDTWVSEEKLAVLYSSAISTYAILQLKEQQETIKVWKEKQIQTVDNLKLSSLVRGAVFEFNDI